MLSKIHRVELDNFKSYYGKAAIGPFKDFTCIVGPNGAGKSNLMDALSFVLRNNLHTLSGTAALRGKAPVDFIHRKARKSGEGCGVTLVMRHPASHKAVVAEDGAAAATTTNGHGSNGSNGSSNETAFTRRVDAQGVVTCLLNGKPVTEKQYVAALAQHRIGERVDTFLVFQHQVEAVAQKKAKQLTELLEQVSGSGDLQGEYNAKKAAVERANEALTTASLEKRGAAVAVQQMRLAKKEAERYEELFKQFNDTTQELALTELFALETELEKQKSELQQRQAALADVEKGVVTEEAIRDMKRTYAARHKAYLEELKKARKSADDLRNKHNTVERIKAALAHLTRKSDIQQQELAAAQKATTIRSAEAQRLEGQLQKQKALLETFEKSCVKEDKERVTLHSALTPQQLEEYRRLRKEADCETVTLRQRRETVLRQRDSIQEGLKQCERRAETHQQQKKELEQAIETATAYGGELQRRRSELEETVVTLQRQLVDAKNDLEKMQTKSKEREAELAKLQEQLHEMRYMKDTNKQNSRMADALQALRSLFPLRGRMVDLCTVPSDRHRNAVTVAMGKNLEAIVVDTTAVAIRCVKYLKEQRMPPMTFLPLDSVQGKAVDDRLRTFGGTCKPIVDVVRFDAELEPAVRFALGQTLLCDAVAEAKTIAYGRPDGERFKVVTLDGTVLLKNGSVQGGLASVQSRARKWDEKKYEDLRVARDRLLSEAAVGGEAELARLHIALRDMEARRDFAAKRIDVVRAEQAANDAKTVRLREEVVKLEGREAEYAERHAGYTKELQAIHKELLETSKAISRAEGQVFAEFQKTVDVPNLLHLEGKEAQEAKQRAERRQELLLVVHKLESSLEMEVKQVGGNKVADLEEARTRLEKEKNQCKKDLADYKLLVEKAERQHLEVRKSATKSRAELDALENQIRSATRNSEVELGRLAQARKLVTALQIACDSLRLRRLNLVRRCQMDEIALPLKPHASSGTKRGRGEESDASTLVSSSSSSHTSGPSAVTSAARRRPAPTSTFGGSGVLLLSEPFSLVVEGPGAEGNARKTATSSSPPVDTEAILCIDFSSLAEPQRLAGAERTQFAAYRQRTQAQLEALHTEMESLAPNIKASARMTASEDRLGTSSTLVEETREAARVATREFNRVKELRTAQFMEMYEKVAATVDRVYRELTMGTRAQAVHGSAYLSLEDVEEPYLSGTTYHATPPLKRFMPMELLSGGERTMAALALLFAIHEVSPTPFFVLDEVDAALDAGNVEKLANYLRKNCQSCQFVVVSLKDQLYHMADILLGVMKDKERESSKVLTMDLRGYPY
ncbi:putative structural maintenance of chromosome (SMC) family protein [Leptomonas pyrrhocoris]|uniref:Structural maintenance of chromosomes protein n=1 Tax=Leptomonas pyrrhocoris TaxID=157538 RepID=A0A0M9GAR4_LEPPY|nr:putative structural maintenance of chromosome (SMC) family protein [Leptomonas pyrrhocoris]KPA86407.1 putative structural maintenance of chromosome (SMC) family protein [Leptomonas pyrrhocoris]|eukprot:XP_015664846.1 putative structural maintenance of chromosome (SMC) family protein [Leptomonas pyrrhocoris]